MGVLRVSGSIDTAQFWPQGASDADTTKILVTPKSFEYQAHPGAAWKKTKCFDGASVKGQSLKPVLDKKGRIVVRLQGIDAPELHYRGQAVVAKKDRTPQQEQAFEGIDHEFRQHWGETSTIALGTMLRGLGASVACRVETHVEYPNDVFDMYGRLVGNIIVRVKGKDVDVNAWLLSAGWAFPAFYTSMSNEEIQSGIDGAKAAKKKNIESSLSHNVGQLDTTLVYRAPTSKPSPGKDKGAVLFPKMFRRLVAFTINQRGDMFNGDFSAYLKAHPDPCFVTKDFMENSIHSAKERKLQDFVLGDQIRFEPAGLVFKEKPSTLLGPNKKPVTKW